MMAHAMRASLFATATATTFGGFLLQQLHDPWIPPRKDLGHLNDRHTTQNKQPSQILIALLGNASQLDLATR